MAGEAAADSFSRRIKARAEDPLFSDFLVREFSEYLLDPYVRSHKVEYLESSPFLHEIALRSEHPFAKKSFAHLTEFEKREDSDSETAVKFNLDSGNRLVFLTGKGAARWLNAISAAYSLDPIFYLTHDVVQRATKQKDFFTTTRLPSDPARSTVLRLTIPTIGSVRPANRAVCKDWLAQARKHYTKLLGQQRLASLTDNSFATPVVRSLAIHDYDHFTIDQEVTITLVEEELYQRWTVVAWFDCASKQTPFDKVLLNDEGCEFFSSGTWIEWCPTVLHRQAAESNLRHYSGANSGNMQKDASAQCSQTAANLPAEYGMTLDARLAAQDPFYALHELYGAVAAAELQFANMLEQILQSQIDELLVLSTESRITAADFEYNRGIVESHLERIQDVIDSMEDGTPLPMQTRHGIELEVELMELADRSRRQLLADFHYLHKRLHRLTLKCQRGIEQVMSNASLLEARSANQQSDGIAKLTKLGTWITVLYVPLSFVTSVFGMNVSQLDQGPVSIWIWVAVSGPVLLFSLILVGIRALTMWIKEGKKGN